MRIILEWIDKNWKTTLANAIKEKFWRSIVKFSAPKEWEDLYNTYHSFALNNKNNIIYDRFRIGENIYWPIYRWKSQLWDIENKNLDLLCSENFDLIIYCFTDVEQTAINFIKDWEEFTKIEHIKDMNEKYLEILSKLNTRVIRYDYRLQNIETILDIIYFLNY